MIFEEDADNDAFSDLVYETVDEDARDDFKLWFNQHHTAYKEIDFTTEFFEILYDDFKWHTNRQEEMDDEEGFELKHYE